MEAVRDKSDKIRELNIAYLGQLQQLGLGTDGGINTNKSFQEINQATLRLREIIGKIEDFSHYSCIDDRFCIGNCGNGAVLLRPGQAGGTLAPTMAALYANSDIATVISNKDPNGLIWDTNSEICKLIEVFFSSHTGGCGAAAKLLKSTETIYSSESLKKATKTLMLSLHDDSDYGGFAFNDDQYDAIRENAGLLLPTLDEWKPEDFTQKTKDAEPVGVEELEHDDRLPHHGHKSDVIFVIKGGGVSIPRHLIPSIGLSGGFVWNVDESLRTSKLLAGHKGREEANKALMANIAWHLATADSLIENQHLVLVSAN